jgi:uncharacterized membrane protein
MSGHYLEVISHPAYIMVTVLTELIVLSDFNVRFDFLCLQFVVNLLLSFLWAMMKGVT